MNKPHTGSVYAVIKEAIFGIQIINDHEKSLDDFLDFELRNKNLRRTISHLFFTYFRHKKAIDDFLKANLQDTKKIDLYNYLSMAITHCNFQDGVRAETSINAWVEYSKRKFSVGVSKLVNAILRKSLRTDELKNVDIPPVILSKWKLNFSEEELEEFRKLYSLNANFTFRTARNFNLTDDVLEELEATKIELENNPFNWYSSNKISKVINSELLANGSIYIQDIATSHSIGLLTNVQNHKNCVDLCGAPGGKAIMVSELFDNQIDLTILDNSEKRQELTKENIAKRTINAKIGVADATKYQSDDKFDIVIADVPCSNSGVFRRRPDALWRFNKVALVSIIKIQKAILDNAAKLVADGGVLLYSTCSIEKEEDSLLIEKFLQKNPNFILEKEILTLPSMQSDGSYAALLKKI